VGGRTCLRFLNVAELGSLDLEPVIAFLGDIPDLGPDVLPLAIAIGPYHEGLGVAGLGLYVGSDARLLLYGRVRLSELEIP
jgi:hypothetical protein